MPVKKVQVGQVWKREESGESFLITKVYSEALTTYAVLRRTGAETEPPVRVKVAGSGTAQTLPGFSFAQQSDEF
jgi:hypothetical protein